VEKFEVRSVKRRVSTPQDKARAGVFAAGDPIVNQTPIADCRSPAFCIEVLVLMMAGR
jgi:hypothetical protein